MKISIEKSEFIAALDAASKAAATKTTVPILEGLMIEAANGELKITGNNLEIAIQSTVDAEIIEPGEVVANAKILIEIIKKMPDEEIDIKTNGKKMTIEAGKTKMEIPIVDTKGFPTMVQVSDGKVFEIDAKDLKETINKVGFAASIEESKGTLTCIHINKTDGKLDVVAMDGHVMAMKTLNIDSSDISILIRKENIVDAIKAFNNGKIAVLVNNSTALLDDGKTKVSLRLFEGKYINYKSAVSIKQFNSIAKVDTKACLSVIERAALISDREPVKLFIGKNIQAKLESTKGTIDDIIPTADIEGETFRVAYNPKLLIECLKNVEDKEIIIKFVGQDGPCVIAPVSSNKFMYFIAAVRANW